MEIYIETFLLQNILINFCLLKLVELVTKYKTSLFKLIISSIIGSTFSILSYAFIYNNLILNLAKFACACAMLMCAFKINFKQFAVCFIMLFVFTYALGGAIINLSSASYLTNFGIITKSKFNLTHICLFVIILTYTIQFIAKGIKNHCKLNNYIYCIQLELNSKKVKINAYLDSGNLLQYQNKPVAIIDLTAYLKLTKTDILNFYLNKNLSINTSTVAGNQNLKLAKVDKITIFAKKKIVIENQYVAINTNRSFKNTNYQALLSPLML